MSLLLLVPALLCLSRAAYIKQSDPMNPQPCPENWVHYRESCFLFQENPAALDQADTFCNNLNTTLFVPNTIQEFDFVTSNAPEGDSWIGMFKQDEKAKDDDLWQVRDGLNPHMMAWRDGEDNGWSSIARCAAVTKSGDSKMMNFHPCYMAFNFICERNATLFLKENKLVYV